MLEWLRLTFPVNRVVALLTPLAATAAGLVSAWLADHLPLIAEQVDQGELTAIFLAGAASVVVMAHKWLEGWQRDEDRQLLELPEMTAKSVPDPPMGNPTSEHPTPERLAPPERPS